MIIGMSVNDIENISDSGDKTYSVGDETTVTFKGDYKIEDLSDRQVITIKCDTEEYKKHRECSNLNCEKLRELNAKNIRDFNAKMKAE